MRREVVENWTGPTGAPRRLVAYGHYGRPVLLLPSANGCALDLEQHGLVDAVHELVDDGRAKVYAVDSYDARADGGVPDDELARRHADHEAWVLREVVPWIDTDCRSSLPILVAGAGKGAFHAVDLALKRPDLFPVALALSGDDHAGPVDSPAQYLRRLGGDHLDWLRERVFCLLAVGPDSADARELAGLLAEKGLPHELDVWDAPGDHDWPLWRSQLGTYLPRFT